MTPRGAPADAPRFRSGTYGAATGFLAYFSST